MLYSQPGIQHIIEIQDREIASLYNSLDYVLSTFSITFTIFGIVSSAAILYVGWSHRQAKKHMKDANQLIEEAVNRSKEIENDKKLLEKQLSHVDKRIEDLKRLINSKELDEKLSQIDRLVYKERIRDIKDIAIERLETCKGTLYIAEQRYKLLFGNDIKNDTIFGPKFFDLLHKVNSELISFPQKPEKIPEHINNIKTLFEECKMLVESIKI